MITSNVIHRTFYLSSGDSFGTCFTIDVDGREYVITAKHVVEHLADFSGISIFHDAQWKPFGCTLVGFCESGSDIAVLSANTLLSPRHSMPPTSAGIVYGQDVYFLGFPYGWSADVKNLNRGFPLPFVKKAIVSNMPQKEGGKSFFYLDGHNNPGFSGGPVVFKCQGTNEFHVAAIISGYRYTEEPIFQDSTTVPLVYRYNTGIILAYDISHAIAVINKNPIGRPFTE